MMQRCKSLTWLSMAALCLGLALGPLEAGAEPNAYVANTTGNVVSVIDAATDAVLATIPVGDAPTQVAVAADGTRAYVTNSGSASVSVIDMTNNSVIATISMAASPSALALTPDGSEVYVLSAEGVLEVIDTALVGSASNPVIDSISIGPASNFDASIAILPDGTRAYALVSGSLEVIATSSRTVVNSVPVGTSPSQLVISPDGSRAYVTNAFGYTQFGLDGQVVVVDTASDSVLETISLPTLPGAIALTPDGSRAYVASEARLAGSSMYSGFVPDSNIAVIDLASHEVSWIPTPGTPGGVAVTPDGSLVYVAIPDRDSIAVIEAATDALIGEIGVSAEPLALAIGKPAAPAPAAESGDLSTASAQATPATASSGSEPTANAQACGLGFELVLFLPPLLWLRGRRREL